MLNAAVPSAVESAIDHQVQPPPKKRKGGPGRHRVWPWQHRPISILLPVHMEAAVRAEAERTRRPLAHVLLEFLVLGMSDRLPAQEAAAVLAFARKETTIDD